MIRVFIGTSERFKHVEHIARDSILANTTADVDIRLISPERLNAKPSGCTGFTNLRYAVPELAGYEGYAIYLDVDMIVLGDIAELYEYRQEGAWVRMYDGASEVSVIDCAAHNYLPKLDKLHLYWKNKLHGSVNAINAIPPEWNVKDCVKDAMKLLHFTSLKHQPWVAEHPCPEAVEIYQRYA